MEFNNNNNTISIISIISFYFNKGFHPRINFDPDYINYEITKKRLQTDKTNTIVTKIQELLKYKHQRLKKNRKTINTQINKYRKKIAYNVDDYVWLNSKNIQIDKSYKNLENKQLKLYKIIEKMETFYRLKFPKNFKSHNVFGFNSLRPIANDPLFNQKQKSSKPVIISKNEK